MRMLTDVELSNGTITKAKIELRNVKTAYDVDNVVSDVDKLWKSPIFEKSQLIGIIRKGGI